MQRNLFNFAGAYRLRSPDMGLSGGVHRHNYKSVYPALVLDGSKSGSFKITVRNEATIGAFRVWYTYVGVCSDTFSKHLHISYSVRLRVARSTVMGTCQSLDSWDE